MTFFVIRNYLPHPEPLPILFEDKPPSRASPLRGQAPTDISGREKRPQIGNFSAENSENLSNFSLLPTGLQSALKARVRGKPHKTG